MNQLQVYSQFFFVIKISLWYRCMWIFIKIVRLLFEIFDIQNFPISQSRFLCRMISRENCFNDFKIWWRCRVCILFECVLRVKEFVYEFQIFEVKTDSALISNLNFSWTRTALCILENGNDTWYVCVLFTCFCVLLSLIYSALHRYMKLARYSGQLEAEKYVNGIMQFIDNFVCGIGNIFVKFHQETLSTIQNKCY